MYFPDYDADESYELEPIDFKAMATTVLETVRSFNIPLFSPFKRAFGPLLKGPATAVEDRLRQVVSLDQGKLSEVFDFKDADARSFALTLLYSEAWGASASSEETAEFERNKEELARLLTDRALSSFLSTEYDAEAEHSSWGSWFYGGVRNIIGAAAETSAGQKTAKLCSTLVGVVANSLILSHFVDHEQEVTPEYVVSSIFYMRMAAFMSLLAKKGIEVSVERCREYYFNRKSSELLNAVEAGSKLEESEYIEFVKGLLKDALPSLENDQQRIDAIVAELCRHRELAFANKEEQGGEERVSPRRHGG